MLGPLNAIAYGQFKLRGGIKNMMLTGCGYGLGITLLLLLTIRLNDDSGRILAGWVVGLLILQTLALLMFGCGTVSAAVRTDVQGGMIESHRLMPIAPGFAVGGYLIGAPVQALSLAAANFVIGLFVCMRISAPIQGWAIANVMMLLYALFLWVLQVFTGFQTKNAFGVMFMVILVVTVSRAILIIVLPGLTVLASPVGLVGIYSRAVGSELTWPLAVSFLAQFVVGAICYAGAARRYRRSDVPALGTFLSLLLLAAWAGVSIVGLHYYERFVTRALAREMQMRGYVQVIATLLATLVLGLIPLANAARAWHEHLVRRAAGDRRIPAPVLVPPIAVLACLIILGAILFATARAGVEGDDRWIAPRPPVLLLSLACAACFFVSMISLFRMAYRRAIRVIWPVILFLVLAWVGPLVADYARFAMSDLDEPPSMTALSTASPIGSFVFAWADRKAMWAGLVFQGALAALLFVLDVRDAARWKAVHFSTGLPASPQALIPPSRL